MARRNPPARPPRVVRLGAGAIAVALGAGVVVALGGALGPPIVQAEPAPDLARARELYRSAEAAMQDGRYDDAARDYGAAYELSADPALFYKIGRASERAGKCDVALLYYARYLREGKPTEQFTALTRERIAACGGDRADGGSAGTGGVAPGPGDASRPAGGAAAGPAAGADTAIASAPGKDPRPAEPARGGSAAANAGGSASGASSGSAGGATPPAGATGAESSTASPEGPTGTGTGSGAGSGSAAAALIPPTRQKIAWLMGGGAIALVTLGGVLAYAASSSESDVRDLYAGFAGQAPMFDAQTRKRYDDLVDQGRRYQHLSWAAFGLAGAAAVGVAVLFTVGRGDEPAPPRAPTVTPVVGPRGAGVSVRF